MTKVTGIGGVFFRAKDPESLTAWYREHLGLPQGEARNALFTSGEGTDGGRGMTVWGAFDRDTAYFGPSGQSFMINYRVDDLDGVLARLRAAGVDVDDKVETYDYGRFGWFTDPDGNRVELWEPTDVAPS